MTVRIGAGDVGEGGGGAWRYGGGERRAGEGTEGERWGKGEERKRGSGEGEGRRGKEKRGEGRKAELVGHKKTHRCLFDLQRHMPGGEQRTLTDRSTSLNEKYRVTEEKGRWRRSKHHSALSNAIGLREKKGETPSTRAKHAWAASNDKEG